MSKVQGKYKELGNKDFVTEYGKYIAEWVSALVDDWHSNVNRMVDIAANLMLEKNFSPRSEPQEEFEWFLRVHIFKTGLIKKVFKVPDDPYGFWELYSSEELLYNSFVIAFYDEVRTQFLGK